MGIVETIALSMGAGWASGVNLYAALLTLGLLEATGNIVLPPDLQVLANPLVIMAAGIMYAVEFFADKIPGVDTAWDSVHTFIRIPAGAILAAGAVGDLGVAPELVAAILGGSLAAASHGTKAGTRVLINTSPEPFSNWTASVAEDVAVIGGLWAALHYPWVFIGLLVVFVLVMIWVLPRLWRGIKGVFGWLRRKLGGRAPKPAEPATDQPSVDTTEQPPDTPEPSVNTTDQPPDTVEPSVNTTDRPAS